VFINVFIKFNVFGSSVTVCHFYSLVSRPGSNQFVLKVHPITGHEGPEGEQRYNSTLSLTLALDGGRFTLGTDPVPIV
jgi:hypothetical protein